MMANPSGSASIGLTMSGKLAGIPSQPDHLTDEVKSILKLMHTHPENAAGHIGNWRSMHGSELCFNGATFNKLTLAGANLSSVELEHAEFRNCNLRGTDLRWTKLSGTRFVGVQFDRDTRFATPKSIQDCSMERYAIACLGPGHGGLTEGNLMDMKIVDHVADLRLRFSGFRAWIHVISIVVFFFPYAWFLFIQWEKAKWILPPDESVAIWTALWRYIWNGGRDWQSGWHLDFWSMFRFAAVLTYQVVRITLLAKTKTLEMNQVITGLPAKFSLDQPSAGWKLPMTERRFGKGFRWRWALRFVEVFIWVTVAFALWNAFHFLNMRVPV